MKWLSRLLVMIVMAGSATLWAADGVLPGGGTEGVPYLIEDLADFDAFADSVNAATYWASGVYTRLECDIDLAGRPYTTAVIAPDTERTAYFQGNSFTGIFDGVGHVISNITIDTTGSGNDYLGLFGMVEYSSAEVKNLGIDNINITGGGGSAWLGGLCGWNSYGSITNCYTTGSVSGGRIYGGLCGYNSHGSITNCYTTGSVTGGDYSDYLGGLCGVNDGTISNCYSGGLVTGRDHLGGLCGENVGTIANCYATGSVTGRYYVGGLCGYKHYGTITNCYATGLVTGDDHLGGLCGRNYGTFTNCFWDKETTGQATSAGGWAMTTTQMKQETTYIGWNNGAWTMNDGNDYPHLLWEGEPDSLITTDYPARTYSGDGISQPFEIVTAADLYCMSRRADDWGKDFVLKADIDMAAISDYWPVSDFSGSFDGDGHTISNLTIDVIIIGNRSELGLFGSVTDGSDVRNIGLINVYITGGAGSRSLGGLCGFSRGTITNCYATGLVTGGGGSRGLGGLCGLSRGTITNCYATGSVNGNSSLGGLCGSNDRGTITNCYSGGSVTGDAGSYYLGGLCGRNWSGTITNCYSGGSVNGNSSLGGLCGYNRNGTIANCFWDIEVGGPDNGFGTPLPTEQMQTLSTFVDAGWDFDTPVWTIDEDVDYPRLWWAFVPVLHGEPEVTLGTSNGISWDAVVGGVEYYVECGEDEDFTSVVSDSGWILETSCEFIGLQTGQRYWYRVKAKNAAGVETQWSNVESSLQVTLGDAVDMVLDPASLKNGKMKNALLNKIDAALGMVDAGLYEDALDKLRNDILAKTNGCAETGEPDKNDWIITCEQQSQVYGLVMETIEYVRSLLE